MSAEPTIRLECEVRTLDGHCLLEEGTELTAAVLEDLAAEGRKVRWHDVPLLGHGPVREDIHLMMDHGPYRSIFGDPKRRQLLGRLMESVRLPVPLVGGLDYFRRKDFFTYRHILMVFALSCFVASELLSEDRQVNIETSAGPLHDLGKICVPLHILRKSTPLLRSERRKLEGHAAAGYALLAYYLRDHASFAAQVARDHHERRDGSGYPRGIRLGDTMVEIVSACDVYDALITPRPYRRGSYDNRTALEEITELAQKGAVGWKVVRTLVALNRADGPDPDECVVSLEKRGTPPEENCYGVIVENGEEDGSPAA